MLPRPLLALLAASAPACAALANDSESRTVQLPYLNVTGYAQSTSGEVDLPNPILSWFSIPCALSALPRLVATADGIHTPDAADRKSVV